MDDDKLLELYKTTLEEIRHHDTINMQIMAALGVVITLFVNAIGLFFSRDFPLRHILFAKIGFLALFALILALFYFSFRRIEGYFQASQKVMDKIKEELKKNKNERQKGITEDMLIKVDSQDDYSRNRFCIYIILAISFMFLLAFFLFVFIKP